MLKNQTWIKLAGVCVIVTYLALTIVRVYTEPPGVDEGYFANAAFNLLKTGRMATTVLESAGTSFTRMDQRTYWVMPLQPFTLAAWFKVFSFGVIPLRLYSVFWGLVALASWFVIVRALWGGKALATLVVGLLSIDYIFIVCASSGRMDMMSAALGFAGIATYLMLRESRFVLAVLLSQTLIVASGLTHPMGILSFFGLLFISLYLDWRRIRLKHIGVALLPYVVGSLAWGAYISQDFQAFKDQLSANAMMGSDANVGDRFVGLRSPLTGLKLEITQRYVGNFASALRRGERLGPAHFKLLILGLYVLGVVGTLLIRSIRRSSNYRMILVTTLIYFLGLTFIDSQKAYYYLIHIVPFYLTMVSLVVAYCWANFQKLRKFIVFALGFLAIFEISGILYRAKANINGTDFQPAANFLKTKTDQTKQIAASSAVALGLGYPPHIVHDPLLGYRTGRRFDYIVVDSEFESSISTSQGRDPQLYEYLMRLFQEDYVRVFENGSYTVYERKQPPGG